MEKYAWKATIKDGCFDEYVAVMMKYGLNWLKS